MLQICSDRKCTDTASIIKNVSNAGPGALTGSLASWFYRKVLMVSKEELLKAEAEGYKAATTSDNCPYLNIPLAAAWQKGYEQGIDDRRK